MAILGIIFTFKRQQKVSKSKLPHCSALTFIRLQFYLCVFEKREVCISLSHVLTTTAQPGHSVSAPVTLWLCWLNPASLSSCFALFFAVFGISGCHMV